jgi:hypothetical protein
MTRSTSLRVILSDGSTLLTIPSEVEGLKGVEG